MAPNKYEFVTEIGFGAWTQAFRSKEDPDLVYLDSTCEIKQLMSNKQNWKSRCIPRLTACGDYTDFDYCMQYYTIFVENNQLIESDQDALTELYNMLIDLNTGACDRIHAKCTPTVIDRLKLLSDSPIKSGLLEQFNYLDIYLSNLYLDICSENLAVHNKRLILLDCFSTY